MRIQPSAPTSSRPRRRRRIFEEGRNIWARARADHMAVLIDAASYLELLPRAFMQAERSILILAWDIDSRLPFGRGEHGMPRTLGPFLDALVRRKRHLHVRILSWDYSAVYLFERELLPRIQLGARTHRRVHFELDGDHPIYAAHHQKVIVIDDALAFSGGIDLCDHRWDTPAHLAHDPARVTLGGKPYPPFHDVQAMVDGEAARLLGRLARARWERATGERIPAPPRVDGRWPDQVAADLLRAEVGVARTEAEHRDRPEVREVEQLYLDAIAAARRSIYIENQYLTAGRICDALAARLAERTGPEVLIVVPSRGDGWIESQTVGVAHARSIALLEENDRHDRLRILCPYVPDGAGDVSVFVHSKLLIVDEQLLRVGSANLTKRSLGVDTECDLAVEAAEGSAHASDIARVRARLLGEHLGLSPDEAQRSIEERGLVATVDALGRGRRGLRPRSLTGGEPPDATVPDATVMAFADPDMPVTARDVLDATVPPRHQLRARAPYLKLALTLGVVAGLALAWRFTPLASFLRVEQLTSFAQRFRDQPLAPLLLIGAFAVGAQLLVPVNLLILASILVLGPLVGAASALAGSVAAAALGYAIGGFLGRDFVRRLGGRRAVWLRHRVSTSGVMPVLLLRIVPVAPAQIVSMVAGAWRTPLRSFLIGTALGTVPGVVALSALGDRLWAVLAHPGPKTILAFVLIALVLVGLILWSRAQLRRSAAAEAR